MMCYECGQFYDVDETFAQTLSIVLPKTGN